MTQKEIQERNKQIALMRVMNNDAFLLEQNIKASTGLCHLKFHSDWNWLMEAVEFIEKIGETDKHYGTLVDITTTYIKIGKITIDLKLTLISKIEAVFIAVSDFAKLYNEKKL